jgi:hypothetical protein
MWYYSSYNSGAVFDSVTSINVKLLFLRRIFYAPDGKPTPKKRYYAFTLDSYAHQTMHTGAAAHNNIIIIMIMIWWWLAYTSHVDNAPKYMVRCVPLSCDFLVTYTFDYTTRRETIPIIHFYFYYSVTSREYKRFVFFFWFRKLPVHNNRARDYPIRDTPFLRVTLFILLCYYYLHAHMPETGWRSRRVILLCSYVL